MTVHLSRCAQKRPPKKKSNASGREIQNVISVKAGNRAIGAERVERNSTQSQGTMSKDFLAAAQGG